MPVIIRLYVATNPRIRCIIALFAAAFAASAVPAHAQYIFTNIADTATTTPNSGTFSSFFATAPAISGNTVVFRGNYTGGTGVFGIFASMRGVVVPVIRQGSSLFGSTVMGLNFGRLGVDGGNIAFGYTLSDGRTGVGLASLAVAVPEANAGLLALLALPALGSVRRRK